MCLCVVGDGSGRGGQGEVGRACQNIIHSYHYILTRPKRLSRQLLNNNI